MNAGWQDGAQPTQVCDCPGPRGNCWGRSYRIWGSDEEGQNRVRVVEWLLVEISSHWALGSLSSASSGYQRHAVPEVPALNQSLGMVNQPREGCVCVFKGISTTRVVQRPLCASESTVAQLLLEVNVIAYYMLDCYLVRIGNICGAEYGSKSPLHCPQRHPHPQRHIPHPQRQPCKQSRW